MAKAGQENFLKDSKLVYHTYSPNLISSDHDHCEFCGLKFSLHINDLHEGYSTTDNYHWICKDCYNDFKSEFNWQLK